MLQTCAPGSSIGTPLARLLATTRTNATTRSPASKKALGLQTPFGPHVPHHHEQPTESLSAPEDRLPLRIVAGKPKLELLVEPAVNKRIVEDGGIIRVHVPQVGGQRIEATDKLDVLRHRSAKYRAGSSSYGAASPCQPWAWSTI